jgi:serine protease Do
MEDRRPKTETNSEVHMRRIILPLLLVAAAASVAEARQSVVVAPRARVFTSSRSNDDGDRAMLGISTGSSGKRDTLGLLIEAVTPGSPADKAGLEEGNRISSVNGVSLKLSREDAGESDMSSTMTNRLVREMRKLKAGDDVSLDVWNGKSYKNVKVKTVAANDLEPERVSSQNAEDRPALGISLGSSGSKRDTLGVFVSSVNENGPAEKAGISEGDRIASINGVDLRVPKEDVGDWSVANSRVARLQREIRKLKPGQTVDLAVVEGGRTRTVKVTLGNAKELERRHGFSFTTGEGDGFLGMPPMPPMSPMEPMTPMAPMAPMPPRARIRVFGNDGDAELNFDGLRETLGDNRVNMDELRETLRDIGPRVRAEIDREMPAARDEVRRALEDLRMEMPRIRMDMDMPGFVARIGRRVII